MEQISTFGASPYKTADIQLFFGLDDNNLASSLAACPIVRMRPGQYVTDAHKARLYIVLRGALAVAADTRTGMADGTVSKVLPGESVGEQSVLDEQTNFAAISALEETDLLVIEPDIVWQLIDQSNVLARNLLRLLSFRIRAASAQLRRREKVGEFYRQLSMIDGLTGLFNRAWLNDALPSMVATAHAGTTPMSIIMIDLDHFKRFNDSHGHQAGDKALCAAAKVLNAALRPTDFAARYGGEELIVLLPDTKDKVAMVVAKRLCERLRQTNVLDGKCHPLPHITASFGVACLTDGLDDQGLMAAADSALYRAKNGGRNRVSL